MNRAKTSLLGSASALLFAFCAETNAIDVGGQVVGGPTQVTGTSAFSGGLVAWASTTWYSLSAAAGFTVVCEYSSLPITAEAGDTVTNYLPRTEPLAIYLVVPSPAPSQYQTAGFQTIPAGQCRLCNFSWKATATEQSVGFSGLGVNVQFPTSSETKGNTVTFQMCSPGGGGGGGVDDDCG